MVSRGPSRGQIGPASTYLPTRWVRLESRASLVAWEVELAESVVVQSGMSDLWARAGWTPCVFFRNAPGELLQPCWDEFLGVKMK